LFQPFFSTKAGRGGTGLGMMIVGDLVRKTLGGTLDVNSSAGVGTTMRIDLPLVAPLPNA
jgi:signal transduction histidine kinase